jgi:hypothetical protein
VTAFLYTAIAVSEPVARMNTSGPVPFALVELDEASRTEISLHTPAEARALAAAFMRAALLLERHAAGPEMTP